MNVRASVLLVTGLLAGPSAWATSFSSLTVFGDSLSDTGNVFLATGGAVPTAPYFNGRFSDGPVWIDHLAAGLGLPAGAVPALAGGGNYAFGGARTDAGAAPVPGLLAQVGGLWAPANPFADPTGLYVYAGGGNDMRDARSAFQGVTPADDDGRQAAAAAAITNMITGLSILAGSGAQSVLITNLPDLGATPEAFALGLVAASTDATARFNALIPTLITAGESFGLDVYFFDLAGLAAAIRDDALNNGGAVYGVTNVLTPCGPFPGSIGIPCNVSLFSDALHPTALAHRLAGLAALRAVTPVSVPEPSTLALFACSLIGLAVARRRRAARPAID
jgi:outer membrane lipase/esterase